MGRIVELKTSQGNSFRIISESINSLISQVNISFYPFYIENENSDDDKSEEEDKSEENLSKEKKTGGVIIKELNKTGKVLIFIRLDADKFDSYKYEYQKKKLTIGVDVNNLLKCLKCMGNNDIMTWYIDDSNMNCLNIEFESAISKRKKKFKLNLMESDEEGYGIKPINFSYEITLHSSEFHKHCKELSSVNVEKIDLKATANTLYLSGVSDIGLEVEYEFGKDTNSGLIIETDTPNEIVQGLFELKFIMIFTKCTNAGNNVTLFMKNDHPVVITYPIGSLGEIKFVLTSTKKD